MDGSTEKTSHTRSGPGSARRRVGGSPRARAAAAVRRRLTLSALAARLDAARLDGEDLELHGVATEAARVREGDLFVLLGRSTDTEVARAARRGAAALLGRPEDLEGLRFAGPTLGVSDPLRGLGLAAHLLQGEPSRRLRCAAITGAANRRAAGLLAKAALEGAGRTPAFVPEGDSRSGSHHLIARLRRMKDRGFADVLIEAPADEISRGRFESVRQEVVLHLGRGARRLARREGGRKELEAEADLVRALPRDGVALLNADDPATAWLAEETLARVVTFGFSERADFRGRVVTADGRGSELEVRTPLGHVRVTTRLVGRAQLEALLGALALAMALGASLEPAVHGLEALPVVPGRLERLALPEPYAVWLDGEGEARALEAQLESLRPLVPGRLFVVLGARRDADEDATRRLARVAEAFADVLVLTAGPGEDLASTSAIQALVASLSAPSHVLYEEARVPAIHRTLPRLEEGDGMLVLGEGSMAEERAAALGWFLEGLTREVAGG